MNKSLFTLLLIFVEVQLQAQTILTDTTVNKTATKSKEKFKFKDNKNEIYVTASTYFYNLNLSNNYEYDLNGNLPKESSKNLSKRFNKHFALGYQLSENTSLEVGFNHSYAKENTTIIDTTYESYIATRIYYGNSVIGEIFNINQNFTFINQMTNSGISLGLKNYLNNGKYTNFFIKNSVVLNYSNHYKSSITYQQKAQNINTKIIYEHEELHYFNSKKISGYSIMLQNSMGIDFKIKKPLYFSFEIVSSFVTGKTFNNNSKTSKEIKDKVFTFKYFNLSPCIGATFRF